MGQVRHLLPRHSDVAHALAARALLEYDWAELFATVAEPGDGEAIKRLALSWVAHLEALSGTAGSSALPIREFLRECRIPVKPKV